VKLALCSFGAKTGYCGLSAVFATGEELVLVDFDLRGGVREFLGAGLCFFANV